MLMQPSANIVFPLPGAGFEKEREGEEVRPGAGSEHLDVEGECGGGGVRRAGEGAEEGVVGGDGWGADAEKEGGGVGGGGRCRGGADEEEAPEVEWGLAGGVRGDDEVGVDLVELFDGFAPVD